MRMVQDRPLGYALSVIAVALALAVASGRAAFAYVGRASAPELVLRIAPSDKLASLTVVEKDLNRGVDVPPQRLRNVALSALAVQPLNSAALRVLALSVAMDGAPAKGEQLIDLAERISRRDLLVEIGLIERSVAAGSVNGALVHYDLALRTHPPASQILYPVLTGAIGTEAVRIEIARYLKINSGWPLGFLRQALDTPGTAAEVADIIVHAQVAGQPAIYQSLVGPAVTGLVEAGQFAELGRFVSSIPAAGGSLVRDTGFSPAATDTRLGSLAWQAVDTSGVTASFESGPDGAIQAQINLSAGSFGPVLRRVMALPAGTYVVDSRDAALPVGNQIHEVWQISCLAPVRRKLTEVVSRPGEAGARVLAIPTDCAWQEMLLIVTRNALDQNTSFATRGLTLRLQ